MQWINYIIKGRVISMNGKEKDMIILKSIINEQCNMETEHTENKRRRLHIPWRNNSMIWNYCRINKRMCYVIFWRWLK